MYLLVLTLFILTHSGLSFVLPGCECAKTMSCSSTDPKSCWEIPCDCGKRVKRAGEVAVSSVFTPKEEPPSTHKDATRCNSESLEKVMLENIGDDVKQSKLRIMEAAEALLGGTFNVICAHGDFSYITSTKLFCLTGNEAVKCYAFLSYNQNKAE